MGIQKIMMAEAIIKLLSEQLDIGGDHLYVKVNGQYFDVVEHLAIDDDHDLVIDLGEVEK